MLGIARTATDRVLRAMGPWLATQVPADELPRELLGCGHYGCVYTTGRDDTVLKVTTDPSEVHFVQASMTLGDPPEGIVRYDKILAAEHQAYRGRPVFLIWREAAFDVGDVISQDLRIGNDWDKRDALVAQARLHDFKHFAHEARTVLNRSKDPTGMVCAADQRSDWAWHYAMEIDWDARRHMSTSWRPLPRLYDRFRGADRVAFCLAACRAIAENMENEPGAGLYTVGGALGHYLEKGLLMADVHEGNIGRVDREGDIYTVITDPGHVSDLRARCT